MKKTSLLIPSLLTLAAMPATAADVTFLSQNFSTDPVNYTLPGISSPFRQNGANIFWALSNLAGLTLNPNITGSDGTYLAVQNIDGLATNPFSTTSPAQIDFTVSASAYVNLKLSIALAGMPGAETVNFVRAKTDNDGDGTYETVIFNFTSPGADNQPYTDSVLGQLTATGAFKTFPNIALPTPTAPDGMLRLRLETFNDSNTVPSGESTGIDSILISGTTVTSNTSASNGDWHTEATWSPAIVPTVTSPVIINGHAITIATAAANCNSLTLSSSGSVAASGQSLTVANSAIEALNTTGGILSLDGASTLNLAKANTSASFAGLAVAPGTVLNVTGELTVDANKNLSGATLTTPKLTLAGGTLTKSDGLSIGSGGLFSGYGTVVGTVAVASGGKTSPGTDSTIDTISTSGLTLDSGSLLTLNADHPASLDQIAVGVGGLSIEGGVITFLNGTGTGPATGLGTYNLIGYSGFIGGTGVSALAVANPVPGMRYIFGSAGGFVTLELIQGPLWSGAGGGVWSNPANWSGAIPGPSDTLVYAAGGTSGSSVNDLSGAAFPSIQFESGVSAFTLSGTKVILTGDLSGAVIVNNSTNLQTLSLPIEINSALACNTANGAVTLSGEVSGTGTLVKSGTNTLTLSGPNIHEGGTTLSAGKLILGSATALGTSVGPLTIAGSTTLDSAVADLVIASANPQFWNGSFTFTGTQDLNLGSGAVTMGANCDITVSAKTLTVGGAISGSGRTLTKRGTGTLVLSGAGSAVTKVQLYGGGKLQVSPGASLTSTSTIDLVEGSTLRISSGTFTSGGADQAHDGQWGKVIVEGTGTLTSNGEWLTGRNMGHGSLIARDQAVVNGGGTLRLGRDNIRDNFAGFFNNAQGIFGFVDVFPTSHYGEGGFGSGSVLQIADSAKLTASSMSVGTMPDSANANIQYAYAQVTQSGTSTVTVNGTIGIALRKPEATDVLNGIYNLNGGELKVRQINNGTAAIRGTAAFNLHGGKLTYNNTVAQTDFINLSAGSTTGNGNLYLYETTVIDDNGQAVTINQPILTPNTGDGLALIAVAAPFGSYFMTPEVYISGGGGSGATAIPVLNDAGQVTAITVTNPGLGYTSKPTVQLWYDGGANFTVPATDITMAPNAYTGGLSKLGTGTLTLTGANTYTGATTVWGGILAVNGTSLDDSGKLVINGGKVQATGTETVNTLYFSATPKAAGSWGAPGSGADHLDDAHFVGTAGVVRVLNLGPGGSDYDTWASGFAGSDLSDPAADSDRDGMTNQQEYAFGLNPTLGSSVNPITVRLDQTTGRFSYTRRNPALTDLIYTVLASTDLVIWAADPLPGSQTPDSLTAEIQTVTVNVATPPVDGKLFVRVQAQ
ncbi:MAG: autotransporter-associated beta strand repeat-containing protein [Verrucomicrobia bacterium]|nr:autotransporter-associated beta strand repeat-containing protein [Verrucomicrobiota bacterium]